MPDVKPEDVNETPTFPRVQASRVFLNIARNVKSDLVWSFYRNLETINISTKLRDREEG
jgi:hypothetical protein